MKTIWSGQRFDALLGVGPDANVPAKISADMNNAGVDIDLKNVFMNGIFGQQAAIVGGLNVAIRTAPGVLAALNQYSVKSQQVQDAMAAEAKKVSITVLYDPTIGPGQPRGQLLLRMSYYNHAPPIWNAYTAV